MSTPAVLRGISTAARRTLKAAGLDSCVIRATTSETVDTGRPPYRTLVWRTHVELTGVVDTKAEDVAKTLRAVGHNAVAVDRRTVIAVNPVGFKPCRCVNDKTECTSVHCRNNPPFPGEKRTPFGDTVCDGCGGIGPASCVCPQDKTAEARRLRVTHYALKFARPPHTAKLAALRAVIACADAFRDRVVPAGGSRFSSSTAHALVRLGLLTAHTVPRKGFRITDLGRDVAAFDVAAYKSGPVQL